MSGFNPKQGEGVQVMWPSGVWLLDPRVFVSMYKGQYLCEDLNKAHQYTLWEDAQAMVIEPEPILYNHETWPKQAVWMKGNAEKEVSEMVLAIDTQGVSLQNGFVSFSTAAIDYNMSLDFCQTWQPCHYVPGGVNV